MRGALAWLALKRLLIILFLSWKNSTCKQHGWAECEGSVSTPTRTSIDFLLCHHRVFLSFIILLATVVLVYLYLYKIYTSACGTR